MREECGILMTRKSGDQAVSALRTSVGLRLLAVRDVLNLSQRALAEMIGTSQSAYHKWESGAGWPDVYYMTIWCTKFGVDFNYLYLGRFDGVERNMIARLAAQHPEIVPPIGNKGSGRGTAAP